VTVSIIVQAGQPAALMLAREMTASLADSGRSATLLARDGAALRHADHLEALRSLPGGALLLGFMDDASAVIVQAMAASRGSRLLAQGHHRLTASAARHACTATADMRPSACGLATAAADTGFQAVYLAALGAPSAPSRALRRPLMAVGTGASVSSFLIRL
jgi:hypothetical protein